MATAVYLPTLTVSEDELAQVEFMLNKLAWYVPKNKVAEDYYEGRNKLENISSSVPPHLQNLKTVVGWAGIAVDRLEERLDWQGWVSDSGNDFGLSDVFTQNNLAFDSGLAHLDTLIYGTGFITVGAGYEGEPSPLINVESPKNMTGIWDNRLRRLTAALGVNRWDEKGAAEVTLYTPYANITLERNNSWRVIDRDDHGLGRVMVVQLTNRSRASRQGGRSEITRGIRSYTDQGVRTLLGMEINREFYSIPQKYILGADMSMFMDDEGNMRPAWQTMQGQVVAVEDPIDEDTDRPDPTRRPQVGQFTAASPAPYADQLRVLSQMVAAESALPASYFGFVTANPSSADAIRQEEAGLIKRAERRQLTFGHSWMEVGRLSILVRDGSDADLSEFNSVSVKWRDPATPTRSAAADEASKLIAAGVLPPTSSVTYDRIGLSPQEQRTLEAEARKTAASQRMADIAAALSATSTTAPAVEAAAASETASQEEAA
ncbi:phage portal protein [Streptomyces sp. NPDC005385]|uniref:phage portal protein n=1 Tax=Streptomyces sp. NPDC005385 TaxID=3157039 RepID=UPI0033BE7DF9